MNINILQQKT